MEESTQGSVLIMKKIFLVEDDSAIARNLSLLLRSEGFSVTHAPTKSAAAEVLSEHRFDLALIDISLPDGNGFTVCTEIKARQDIPVIFLTASGDESSVVTGLNMGADDYITKPFRPRELARLGGARARPGAEGSTATGGGNQELGRGGATVYGDEIEGGEGNRCSSPRGRRWRARAGPGLTR